MRMAPTSKNTCTQANHVNTYVLINHIAKILKLNFYILYSLNQNLKQGWIELQAVAARH